MLFSRCRSAGLVKILLLSCVLVMIENISESTPFAMHLLEHASVDETESPTLPLADNE